MATENYNYLYGLTVQGIQQYIFATNKLKEIIGASEIIEKICTTEFTNFVDNLKEEGLEGIILLKAAGNIRFLTKKTIAEKIYKDFYFEIQEKYPGIPMSQGVVNLKLIEETNKKNVQQLALEKLDIILRAERNKNQEQNALGNMARSRQRRIGSFAYKEVKYDDKEKEYLDEITLNKYNNRSAALLTGKLKLATEYFFPTKFSELTKGGKNSWLALIHIDGNGMGNHIKELLSDDNSFNKLSTFSTTINSCTIEAFKKAVQETIINSPKAQNFEKTTINNIEKTILPFRPLILGGDDVTVIMRADFALHFTEVYLHEFEKNTKHEEINNENGLTACAGVAYIKEKFPFHYSTHLAEELCVYAKNECERKHSSIHFHKVQDSIFTDYKDIQKRELVVDENQNFKNTPFYLNNEDGKTSIKTLYEILYEIDKTEGLSNSIRLWIDTCFNNPVMANEIKNRFQQPENFKKEDSIAYLNILSANI